MKVAAAAEFTKTISPQDQARLIDEYGSPASAVKAAVKAKADRASVRMEKPVPDPSAAADRAERRSQRHRRATQARKRIRLIRQSRMNDGSRIRQSLARLMVIRND